MRLLETRVTRLEGPRAAFPWNLPLDRWTDAQLEAVMRDPLALTDAQLMHIAGDAAPRAA